MTSPRALVALAAALLLFASGCRGCGASPAAVARLAELHGSASRAAQSKAETWQSAAPGAYFVLGDALRTGASSTARIDLTGGGALQLKENTLVRFLAQGTAAGSRRVGIEMGEAEIESGGSGLAIDTTLGPAQLEPGSRMHVTATKAGARFEVTLGRAEIDTGGGTLKTLEAGQKLTVGTGDAILEPAKPPGPDASSDAAAVSAVDASGAAEVLANVRGAGVKSAPTRQGPLVALAEGQAVVAEGARLVVPDGASVELSRGAERAVVLGQADVTVGRAGGALLDTQSGRVMLASPTAGTRIDVPGGSIVLTAGGAGNIQAQVTVDRRNARVVSNQSQLELRGRAGVATLGPGQGGTLDAAGVAATEVGAPGAADVTVPAGESPVVHSPHGAAAVRIRFDGACTGDALVETGTGKATRTIFVHGQGISAAVVPMGPGPHRYGVRCIDDGLRSAPQAGGTVTVVHDGGASPLPRTAPVDTIDADGRRYSVLYQTLLPQVTFRWPRAPAEHPVSLHLERDKGRVEVLSAPSASVTLPSGTLPEGSYRFWFEVDGDATVRATDTTLKISFDNAAPAAEIQQPVDGQPAGGDTVHVAGVALEGATISVGGVALALDSDLRFRGDVARPAGDRSLAIRIAHPARGVHYYLRMIGAP